MRFTKMHGTGNDFVFINCFNEPVPDDPAELARVVSDRHFGIGGDGLVLICPSETSDAQMRMFNVDGSEAKMCGNAIRCVAKYLYDHGLSRNEVMRIDTRAGVLALELEIVAGRTRSVRVDMGEPVLEADRIPTTLPGNPSLNGNPVVEAELEVAGRSFNVTCLSMGNPHCVTFVDEPTDDWVLGLGPGVERHPCFPDRVNAEFVEVISTREIRMRVWERGCGETLACGTGASAVCVAGSLTGRTGRKIIVHLSGGDLELEWAEDNHVYLTGPAVEVFSGEWTGA